MASRVQPTRIHFEKSAAGSRRGGRHPRRPFVPHNPALQAHGSLASSIGVADHDPAEGCGPARRRSPWLSMISTTGDPLGFPRRRDGWNLTAQAAIDAALVGAEDGAFAGGSYGDHTGSTCTIWSAGNRVIHRSPGTHRSAAPSFDIVKLLDDTVKLTSAPQRAGTQSSRTGKRRRSSAPICPRLGNRLRAGRKFGTYFIGYRASAYEPPSRCWRTCSSAIPPATTIGHCDFEAKRQHRQICSFAPFLDVLGQHRRCVPPPAEMMAAFSTAIVDAAANGLAAKRWFARYRFPQESPRPSHE